MCRTLSIHNPTSQFQIRVYATVVQYYECCVINTETNFEFLITLVKYCSQFYCTNNEKKIDLQ